MKTSPRHLFPRAAIAFFLTLTLAALAQETPSAPAASPAPPPGKSSPAVAPAEPSVSTTPAPAATTAPAETSAVPVAASAAAATPAATPKPEAEPAAAPKLRRLDVPASSDDQPGKYRTKHIRTHHNSGNEVVHVGGDAYLAKGQKADEVVAVFGSATSEGEVADAVVSVFGNTRVSGPAGDAAVAVFGNTRVTGPIGGVALAVFGNTYVNSKVGDAAVAVFGNIELGPEAEIAGDLVCVGGTVTRDPTAVVHGEVHTITMGGAFTDMDWLQSWIVNCLLYFRPLAFAPHLMWAWWVALGFLAFYVVLALLFGQGVTKCAETLEQRPGYTILAALLTALLAPVVTILLICTGVGIIVVPFLAAGLFFAGLFGKAVMLGWIGRRITRLLGLDHPALAVLFGGVMVLGLYTVPVLGLVMYKLLGWIGLGVVVYTLLLGMKREKPAVPPVASPLPGAPASDPAAVSSPLAPALGAVAPSAPPILSAATLPRAGFWIRFAASLLDALLVGIAIHLFPSLIRPSFPLVFGAYCVVLWALRGTTVGGIVCGLKVVRLDDRPLDWMTATVRALGSVLSFVVLGLGFIWVAFDDQRQSWHDKIAGTTIVCAPKGMSLL